MSTIFRCVHIPMRLSLAETSWLQQMAADTGELRALDHQQPRNFIWIPEACACTSEDGLSLKDHSD